MKRTSRRLRAAGLITAVLPITLAASGCSAVDDLLGNDEPERDEQTGEVTEVAEDISVFDITTGDCLGDFPDGEVETVDLYPCEEEHVQQVFMITEIEDEELPGQEQLEELILDDCLPTFEEFVGLPYEESELQINYLAPSEETWQEGDRDIVCTVVDPSGSVTGSLEGAAR